MNWQKEAINDLKAYSSRCDALENMTERIRLLNDKIKTVRSAMGNTDATPSGHGNVTDMLVNNIAERERLRLNIKATAELVRLTRKGLNALDERQLDILNSFYIERHAGHIENLMEKYFLEQSRIYQLKDEALYKFTLSMYGIIDL